MRNANLGQQSPYISNFVFVKSLPDRGNALFGSKHSATCSVFFHHLLSILET